jgi:hypothetical protein
MVEQQTVYSSDSERKTGLFWASNQLKTQKWP